LRSGCGTISSGSSFSYFIYSAHLYVNNDQYLNITFYDPPSYSGYPNIYIALGSFTETTYEMSNFFVAIVLIYMLPRYLRQAGTVMVGDEVDEAARRGVVQLKPIRKMSSNTSDGNDSAVLGRAVTSQALSDGERPSPVPSPMLGTRTADEEMEVEDVIHPSARALQVLKLRGFHMATSVMVTRQRLTHWMPRDRAWWLLWTYLMFRIINFFLAFAIGFTEAGTPIQFLMYFILMVMCVVAHTGDPSNPFVYVLLVGLGQLASNMPGFLLLFIIKSLNIQNWSQYVWIALITYHIVALILKRYLMYIVKAIPSFYACYIPAWIFYTQVQESLFPKILFLQVPTLSSWFFWLALVSQVLLEATSYSLVVRGIMLDRGFKLYLRLRVFFRVKGPVPNSGIGLKPEEADHLRIAKILASQKMYTNLMGTFFVPLCIALDASINEGTKSLSLGVTDMAGTIEAFAVIAACQLLCIIFAKGTDAWCRRKPWARGYFPQEVVEEITDKVERKISRDLEIHITASTLNEPSGSRQDSTPSTPAILVTGPSSIAVVPPSRTHASGSSVLASHDSDAEYPEEKKLSPDVARKESDMSDVSSTGSISPALRPLNSKNSMAVDTIEGRVGVCDWASSLIMFAWYMLGVSLGVQDVLGQWFELEHQGL